MAVAKKKEMFNAVDSLQSILMKDEWMFQEEISDGGDKLYSEIPVSITEFVSGVDWLGIAPQRHPENPEIKAESPLSGPQLDFIEKATDFENNVVNLVLWVG